MSYSFQIVDETGTDITGLLTPMFFIDRITTSSGSKTYPSPPSGKKLKAMVINSMLWNGTTGNSTVSINGNTISWSGINNDIGFFALIYWG